MCFIIYILMRSFIYIILFLFWRWIFKGSQVVLQMFHLKFTSFFSVHGPFLMTMVKSTPSAIYDSNILRVDHVVCLELDLRACVRSSTPPFGSSWRLSCREGHCKWGNSSLHPRYCQHELMGTTVTLPPESRGKPFFPPPHELPDLFISFLKKWPLT